MLNKGELVRLVEELTDPSIMNPEVKAKINAEFADVGIRRGNVFPDWRQPLEKLVEILKNNGYDLEKELPEYQLDQTYGEDVVTRRMNVIKLDTENIVKNVSLLFRWEEKDDNSFEVLAKIL